MFTDLPLTWLYLQKKLNVLGQISFLKDFPLCYEWDTQRMSSDMISRGGRIAIRRSETSILEETQPNLQVGGNHSLMTKNDCLKFKRAVWMAHISSGLFMEHCCHEISTKADFSCPYVHKKMILNVNYTKQIIFGRRNKRDRLRVILYSVLLAGYLPIPLS